MGEEGTNTWTTPSSPRFELVEAHGWGNDSLNFRVHDSQADTKDVQVHSPEQPADLGLEEMEGKWVISEKSQRQKGAEPDHK